VMPSCSIIAWRASQGNPAVILAQVSSLPFLIKPPMSLWRSHLMTSSNLNCFLRPPPIQNQLIYEFENEVSNTWNLGNLFQPQHWVFSSSASFSGVCGLARWLPEASGLHPPSSNFIRKRTILLMNSPAQTTGCTSLVLTWSRTVLQMSSWLKVLLWLSRPDSCVHPRVYTIWKCRPESRH
jgi:hypothetical protein